VVLPGSCRCGTWLRQRARVLGSGNLAGLLLPLHTAIWPWGKLSMAVSTPQTTKNLPFGGNGGNQQLSLWRCLPWWPQKPGALPPACLPVPPQWRSTAIRPWGNALVVASTCTPLLASLELPNSSQPHCIRQVCCTSQGCCPHTCTPSSQAPPFAPVGHATGGSEHYTPSHPKTPIWWR